jgi:hypothetical protein
MVDLGQKGGHLVHLFHFIKKANRFGLLFLKSINKIYFASA